MLRLRLRALGCASAMLALLDCTSDPSPSSETGSSSSDASSSSTTLAASTSAGPATSASFTTTDTDDTFGTTVTLTNSLDEAFMGIPDYAFGDPCDVFAQDCDAGSKCVRRARSLRRPVHRPRRVRPRPRLPQHQLGAPGLPCEDTTGCCSPYCDFSDPDASLLCPGAADGQVCLPWYPPGEAPAGFEDVGVCSLWP